MITLTSLTGCGGSAQDTAGTSATETETAAQDNGGDASEAETGKIKKFLNSDIELIACGSSLSTMTTYPIWKLFTFWIGIICRR